MAIEVGEYEVEAYLQGLLSPPFVQCDLLAVAANELIETFPQGHEPYPDELGQDGDSPRNDSVFPAIAIACIFLGVPAIHCYRSEKASQSRIL